MIKDFIGWYKLSGGGPLRHSGIFKRPSRRQVLACAERMLNWIEEVTQNAIPYQARLEVFGVGNYSLGANMPN
jgi:hypothetical protein